MPEHDERMRRLKILFLNKVFHTMEDGAIVGLGGLIALGVKTYFMDDTPMVGNEMALPSLVLSRVLAFASGLTVGPTREILEKGKTVFGAFAGYQIGETLIKEVGIKNIGFKELVGVVAAISVGLAAAEAGRNWTYKQIRDFDKK